MYYVLLYYFKRNVACACGYSWEVKCSNTRT